MKYWAILILLASGLVAPTVASSQSTNPRPEAVTSRGQFVTKLRAAPKQAAPLICKGEHILDKAINAYTEIHFFDGCRILVSVPSNPADCCVGVTADVWRFPVSVRSAYKIGYLPPKAADGDTGGPGASGRDWNRNEPGGGATDGYSGGAGQNGKPGDTVQRPKSLVILIGKGIFDGARELNSAEIAKLAFNIDASGAAGGKGGDGGVGGKGGNGEGGSNGAQRRSGPRPGCGVGRGECGEPGELTCVGQPGKPGGRGGAGGVGGKGAKGGVGGDASDLDIFASKQVVEGMKRRPTNWKIATSAGLGGSPGAAGSPGAGGLGGFSGQFCGGGNGADGLPGTAPNPAHDGPGAPGRPGKLLFHPS